MKLWYIYQDTNDSYDTYDSAVVAAETEEDARKTHPSRSGWDEYNSSWAYSSWANKPEQVGVRLIGEAAPNVAVGVICASFNAG